MKRKSKKQLAMEKYCRIDKDECTWEWYNPVGKLRVAMAVELGSKRTDDHIYELVSKYVNENLGLDRRSEEGSRFKEANRILRSRRLVRKHAMIALLIS